MKFPFQLTFKEFNYIYVFYLYAYKYALKYTVKHICTYQFVTLFTKNQCNLKLDEIIMQGIGEDCHSKGCS